MFYLDVFSPFFLALLQAVIRAGVNIHILKRIWMHRYKSKGRGYSQAIANIGSLERTKTNLMHFKW